MTNALFWGTNHFSGEPSSLATSVEYRWNTDFDDPPSISINTDDNLSGFDSNNYNDCGSLLYSLENNSQIQSALSNYDAILVIDDNSSAASCGGIANVESAGGSLAVGWVRTPDLDTTLHELGHIHGCTHNINEEESWERLGYNNYSVMCTDSCPSQHTDCNDQYPSTYRQATYEDCEEAALCNTVWSSYCGD